MRPSEFFDAKDEIFKDIDDVLRRGNLNENQARILLNAKKKLELLSCTHDEQLMR
jgi:hypothetical protein